MISPDQSIFSLLQQNKETIKLLISAFLGFLSTFTIYVIQERKKKRNQIATLKIDLNALIEEIRLNLIAIHVDSYHLEYNLLTKMLLTQKKHIKTKMINKYGL